MMKIAISLILFLNIAQSSWAQEAKSVQFSAVEQRISESKGLTVFNFWATWCRPCVAELPFFKEAADAYKGEATVVLLSLDFAEKLNSHLNPFLKRKGYDMECMLIDEVDYSLWMGKIDSKWDGTIPATLFVNHESGVYEFHVGELSKEELVQFIEKYK